VEQIFRKPELLIPAGSLNVLKTAVMYGADAVYIGGDVFGLRAKARNFSMDEMREGIAFAHKHGAKVHVTVNILAHNEDLPGVETYLREIAEIRPDALIIADPAVFEAAERICPEIDRHVSTQANCTNYGTFDFWYRLGAKRVVCARELTLDEIREIRKRVPEELEIEAFVHGAMCISYSGRCLLSNYFTGRDSNRGLCSHPCRWKYAVEEETRPGEYLPIYENERGTYLFNSRDLCMIEHIPELIEAGIDSFKIEGRMKTELYVASAARTYRAAIDDYRKDPAAYRSNMEWYLDQIRDCTYREFTTGFFFGKPGPGSQNYDSNTYRTGCTYLGTVRSTDSEGRAGIIQKNKFSVGDVIEIMKPDRRNVSASVTEIVTEDGERRESAPHPLETLYIGLTEKAEPFDILRVKNNE